MSALAFCHSTSVLDGAAARCTPATSYPSRSAVPPMSDRSSSGTRRGRFIEHGLMEPFADPVGLRMPRLGLGVIDVFEGQV